MDRPEGLTLTDYLAEEVLLPGREGESERGVRITVRGEWLPIRALEPQILVDDTPAEMVEVTRDQRSIVGYLREPPREGARITVYYDPIQNATLERGFSRRDLQPLRKEC